jgi:hypothetical protein
MRSRLNGAGRDALLDALPRDPPQNIRWSCPVSRLRMVAARWRVRRRLSEKASVDVLRNSRALQATPLQKFANSRVFQQNRKT